MPAMGLLGGQPLQVAEAQKAHGRGELLFQTAIVAAPTDGRSDPNVILNGIVKAGWVLDRYQWFMTPEQVVGVYLFRRA
jgi:hypothetical protein